MKIRQHGYYISFIIAGNFGSVSQLYPKAELTSVDDFAAIASMITRSLVSAGAIPADTLTPLVILSAIRTTADDCEVDVEEVTIEDQQ